MRYTKESDMYMQRVCAGIKSKLNTSKLLEHQIQIPDNIKTFQIWVRLTSQCCLLLHLNRELILIFKAFQNLHVLKIEKIISLETEACYSYLGTPYWSHMELEPPLGMV